MRLNKLSISIVGSLVICAPVASAFSFTSSSRCQSKTDGSFSFTHTNRFFSSHPVKPRNILEMKNSDLDNLLVNQKRKSKALVAKKVFDRLTDTMTPAGFAVENKIDSSERPLMANFWSGGPKRFFFLLFTMLGIKWFRSKFLLKQKFTDKIPAWGHVITSKEQEDVLHAWTCKECGTTMFIAKGREIRFFNRFVECYNCGAKGKDSFYDRRKEIVEKDDTDFEYENPMDYISKGERKKLEREQARLAQMEQATDAEIVSTTVIEETTEEDVAEIEETPAIEESEPDAEIEEAPVIEETEPIAEIEETPAPAKLESSTPAANNSGNDDLDVLGMDF